jgi:hypothetical protein
MAERAVPGATHVEANANPGEPDTVDSMGFRSQRGIHENARPTCSPVRPLHALWRGSEPKDSIRAHPRKLGFGLINVWSSGRCHAHAAEDEMLTNPGLGGGFEHEAATEIQSRLRK